MQVIKYPTEEDFETIVKRPQLNVSRLNATVAEVLNDVRNNGDEAVKRYEKEFDHVSLASLAVTQAELDEAETSGFTLTPDD